MDFHEILFERKNGIAILTLNRPDTRNAISTPEIIEEIEIAYSIVNRDICTRVLVITGATRRFHREGTLRTCSIKQACSAAHRAR